MQDKCTRFISAERVKISLFTHMEKRNYRRMDIGLTATICCEPYRYQATITNISEKGVCVRTTMCFPTETTCTLFIPGKDGVLEVEAVVKRSTKKDGFSATMVFELLKPSRQYREFINKLGGVF